MSNHDKKLGSAARIAFAWMPDESSDQRQRLERIIDAELADERRAAEEMRTLLCDLADILEDEQPYRVELIKKCVADYDATRKGGPRGQTAPVKRTR